MATYKKKYKPKKEKVVEDVENLEQGIEETFDESESTTAEVFNALDETANKSEQWIEKNSNVLLYGLVGVAALIVLYLGYNKFIGDPNQVDASNELAHPRAIFDKAMLSAGKEADSLFKLGLEGGVDGKYGFIDVADKFSGTKAGNIANYYAGISYLKLKKYDKGIEFLSDFNSDDEILGPVALGAIGDAFADIDQMKEALEYYEKAATKKSNEFTSPLFLFKAGRIALELKDFSKAEKLFSTIKEKYNGSDQGRDIERYINIAKYAKQ